MLSYAGNPIIATLKRNGERTEPCGVPLLPRLILSDLTPPIVICDERPERKSLMYVYVRFTTPTFCKLSYMALCVMLSKAFVRSRPSMAFTSVDWDSML